MLENIPAELKALNQWLVWRYEETDGPKPTKVPYSPLNGKMLDVVVNQQYAPWATYEQALGALNTGMYSGLGFILTELDGYAFIDLDNPYETTADGANKYPNPDELFARQKRIYDEFVSYTEFSPSGKGLHIIVKGRIPTGRKRGSIELYSSSRFMTMTGNVYRQCSITDQNEKLKALYDQMSNGSEAQKMFLIGLEETADDTTVINRMINAENGLKAYNLMSGNWQGEYPSASEADQALTNIIAFYTQNRAQIARIFLLSGLGQREKSKRPDYINYNINKSFDQMLPPVDVDGLRDALNALIEKAKLEEAHKTDGHKIEPDNTVADLPQTAYSVPPGLLGEIAKFIYDQAPQPIAEIALAGAMGFMSGIVGRSYNISATGLNQYVLLLAATGTGKEAIAKGIDKLMAEIAKSVPAARDFKGPGEIASPQALSKHLAKQSKCFVSIIGEFGISLKLMSAANAPAHLTGLRRALLHLYNKSGKADVLDGSVYSNRDNNVDLITAPAVSLIGESTPETFYESLSESMITDGLLPRFTVIEYRGDIVDYNDNHAFAKPEPELIKKLVTLCSHSLMLNSQNKAIDVGYSKEAKAILDKFNKHCKENMRGSAEIRRHIWNRAHIKALRLAAVVAIGCDPYHPCIDEAGANWAISLVLSDVRNMLVRFESGEIGVDNDENKQLVQIIRAVRDFHLEKYSELAPYLPNQMHLHAERIVPYSYLHKKLSGIAVFRKDKAGASMAIKKALKTLTERGDLQEVGKGKLVTNYNTSATCFMVAIPKTFGL